MIPILIGTGGGKIIPFDIYGGKGIPFFGGAGGIFIYPIYWIGNYPTKVFGVFVI